MEKEFAEVVGEFAIRILIEEKLEGEDLIGVLKIA